MNDNKILFLEDKFGYPIEKIKGRPFLNFFRRLILTRKIMRYKSWKKKGGCRISN
ncbi:MAG: hypothetical protein ACOCQR_03370 [bacterium]